ncbi:fatty acid oxidation complex subunit alpha FadB [Marinobacter persicus]|jgi:3-hydroxyacyl-CoA dehydrogenase/enoyl-CoA hydratase/3-hydroxybutyryl-CoA epimerase/enoyl-CoA isomerase|uniref:enoyl-CoA hydratase n=1 Tax=Marinobacter persicus TaxID=930118 RepID=A0A2S6G7H4_9GAMM|nr:fatty acid oxidation complex subunit alpha FadB [Marinobacter persicus]PPK52183.1 3-hydroxyacyl-CoA dehydrogenase/enoyl-CoA hydratase/3-hydroxybutyryl-CoA epimerase/enoyl-CoA isomerase [Marinobacter persicus]PPK55129.1 3-hydroxyacyl-CoA dehydrogenase/enoyl-CoA hydratase/3-hydroxybutyryl-CoA epimerase/enoyl-CoA isomerase [Marinobacter persicus]PPK58943.1 3-hydroxyacyl-CoA dehydrogenase/enoyl-CoA hydratase/3-hydroxybutyryl-CoA epimerase/enoyl-CoA isomerase [Marinobacter persicus]
MIYEGKAITVKEMEGGIAQLNFDLQGESVNKLNRLALEELHAATDAVKARNDLKGMVVTSSKDSFIVGADITEFTGLFAGPEEDIIAKTKQANDIFSAIEDLPFPTVTAINGIALGGGLELALSTDYRVMAPKAKIGLPEVKLGIFPGFGGTVRLSRLVGVDNAIEWIAGGTENRADAALKVGAVDSVVEVEKLVESAVAIINQCNEGKLDYQARREEKKGKIKLNAMESMMAFETAKGFVAGKAGKNYPAPVEAIKAMQKHAGMTRDKAIEVEAKGFAKMAKTNVAACLVGLFLNDQALKKKAGAWSKEASEVNLAAVLGAGIMGGGVAYQSALKGTPILMKDINQDGIALGLKEAKKLLSKRVEKGKMDAGKMADVLNSITPTLNYGDFKNVDLVVEAVVENPKVKDAVLRETEEAVREDTILTSNTSTISIDKLAANLKRPENFCGMHFFNPVHMMPLVEVIRGEKTSDRAIATTVAYAKAMGKTPIVVNDCPGFLVNRVLFPYFGGFIGLVRDGADFQKVDKVMEKFGWPMGPAYLLDVVGMDTGKHAGEVMAEGFPDRMKHEGTTAIDVMFDNNRYGQKNDVGFYKYELDKKGKQQKVVDEETYKLLEPIVQGSKEFDEDDIIARMMIPLCLETVRCLEDGIVEDPADADMGLIYGIGFPPFRGGALRYIDDMGVDKFVELADKYADLGALYHPTDKLREMAKNGETFFG